MEKFVKSFLKLFSVFEENQGFQDAFLTFEKFPESLKHPLLRTGIPPKVP
jgi:hypothetical protein